MLDRGWSNSAALAVALCMATGNGAQAFDETRYPDLKGQWQRIGPPRWADPSKAPLTAASRAGSEAHLKDTAAAAHARHPTLTSWPPGMPRVMNVYEPMELVVTPHPARLLMQHIHD